MNISAELLAVCDIAREAGRAALAHYGRASAEAGSEASPVTAADRASNETIVARLRGLFPGDSILSEESPDSTERLAASRLWVVDPLDGTKEFLAANGEFSIMIGLAVGGTAALGVVYRPDGDVLYAGIPGIGAWSEHSGIRQDLDCSDVAPDHLRMVGSRSHMDPLVARIGEDLGISDILPCGSVGLKCALIAEGRRDVYVHPVPYLKEWDTCAPDAILRAAGGFVSDCTGAPLRYNKANPVQPDGIIACNEAARAPVIAAVTSRYRSIDR